MVKGPRETKRKTENHLLYLFLCLRMVCGLLGRCVEVATCSHRALAKFFGSGVCPRRKPLVIFPSGESVLHPIDQYSVDTSIKCIMVLEEKKRLGGWPCLCVRLSLFPHLTFALASALLIVQHRCSGPPVKFSWCWIDQCWLVVAKSGSPHPPTALFSDHPSK